MFCKFCGQEIDDNCEICPKCGAKLKEETIADKFESKVHDFTQQLQPKIEEAGRAPKFSFKWAVYTVLKQKYACFTGRACRSEYWWYILFVTILYFAISIVGMVLSAIIGIIGLYFMFLLIGVAVVGLLVPNIAVTVRRMHDRNVSGLWLIAVVVLSAIPLLDFIVGIGFIIFTAMKGTEGPNKFGADPLTSDAQGVTPVQQ